MRSALPTAFFCAIFAATVSAGEPFAPGKPSAFGDTDLEFARLSTLNQGAWYMVYQNVKYKAGTMAVLRRMEMVQQVLRRDGEAFLIRHPSDPRGWQVIEWMADMEPLFMTDIKRVADDSDLAAVLKAIVMDTAAQKAWSARLVAFAEQCAGLPNLPPEGREALAYVEAREALSQASRTQHEGGEVDVGEVRAKVNAYLALVPDLVGFTPAEVQADLASGDVDAVYGDAARRVVHRRKALADLCYLLEQTDPVALQEEVQPYVHSRDGYVRETAEAKLRSAEARTAPVDLAFTALDGREVDLAKMRGEVVLIEFWATWCGPCIGEVPNLKQVYAKLHDRGFEIVSVSLDLASDRERLEKLVAKYQLPWPQRFGGLKSIGDKDTFAVRFGVKGIPASYLLNKEGRIVAVNLRGARLEPAVERQLGL